MGNSAYLDKKCFVFRTLFLTLFCQNLSLRSKLLLEKSELYYSIKFFKLSKTTSFIDSEIDELKRYSTPKKHFVLEKHSAPKKPTSTLFFATKYSKYNLQYILKFVPKARTPTTPIIISDKPRKRLLKAKIPDVY